MNIKRTLTILLCLVPMIGLAAMSTSFTALAGSFDDGGIDDLAVGIPFEDISAHVNAGRVNILSGSRLGTFNGGQDFTQSTTAGGETSEEADLFGQSLAVGDFNCDGRQDLAIGSPGEDISGVTDAGAVHVIYGQAAGLDPWFHAELWYQGYSGLQGTPNSFDTFGAALAAGDFDGNGCDDLVIGVPFEDVDTASAAGTVQVLYGTLDGLNSDFDQVWSQKILGLLDTSESSDHFGQALAAGDFNHDGRDDLAVGAPGEDLETTDVTDAGAINIMLGGPNGFTGAGSIFLYQSYSYIPDAFAEDNDEFGSVLATGYFNWDSYADLAIGIPYEDTTLVDAGAVEVFAGNASGLYTNLPSRWLTRGDFGGEAAAVNDHMGWALATGNFDGDGYDDLAIGVPDADGAASNTGKVIISYGNLSGLMKTGYDAFFQGDLDFSGTSEANDRFGLSLATGNFNADQYADLVVGVPYEDQDAPVMTDTGAIDIVWGTSGGLTGTNAKYLHQGSAAIADDPEAYDRFVEVLAAVPNYWTETFIPVIRR